jgi:UDP-N-acetylglucosamine transferase subunit ALG13
MIKIFFNIPTTVPENGFDNYSKMKTIICKNYLLLIIHFGQGQIYIMISANEKNVLPKYNPDKIKKLNQHSYLKKIKRFMIKHFERFAL